MEKILKTINISPLGDSNVTFLQGWEEELEGETTAPHRWTLSLFSQIQIQKVSPSTLGINTFELTIDAIPFLPKSGPGFQDVIVFLDGLLLTSIRLYDADPKFVKGKINLPSLVSPFSLLSFYLPNSISPVRVNESDDERQLGIGLKKLELKIS
jgi:hypothetical protein